MSLPTIGSIVAASVLALLAPSAAGSEAEDGWTYAGKDYAWEFPRDHWTHPGYRTEWWYLTGHLRSTEPPFRRFGYQFTFFRVGLRPDTPPSGSSWLARDLIMGHAAISDLDGGRHVFSELLYRVVPLLGGFPEWRPPASPDRAGFAERKGGLPVPSLPPVIPARPDTGRNSPGPILAWSRAPAGTDTIWALRWNGQAFDVFAQDAALGTTLSLSTRPSKPLVLHGPGGFSQKGEDPEAGSQYYSFTRLQTEGRLVIGGREYRVGGQSWMDKEFGSSLLGQHQSGWDWFSLQFDDGRDVMLYFLRASEDQVDFSRGTLVSETGTAQELGPPDFIVRATERWKSPQTGAIYPSRWIVRIPMACPPIDCEVVPELADQENRGRLAGGLFYWEGAVRVQSVDGASIGRGYVELTGYGTRNRPAL